MILYNTKYANNCEIRIINNKVEIWSIRDIENGNEYGIKNIHIIL